MNRAERRRQQKRDAKAEKTANHTMTQYEMGYYDGYEAGKNQAMFELAGYCTRVYTTAVVAVIRSELKFAKIRMSRFLKLLQAQLEDILQGVVSEKKLREWIKKDIGLDLDEFTGSRRLDIMNEGKQEYLMHVVGVPVLGAEERKAE